MKSQIDTVNDFQKCSFFAQFQQMNAQWKCNAIAFLVTTDHRKLIMINILLLHCDIDWTAVSYNCFLWLLFDFWMHSHERIISLLQYAESTLKIMKIGTSEPSSYSQLALHIFLFRWPFIVTWDHSMSLDYVLCSVQSWNDNSSSQDHPNDFDRPMTAQWIHSHFPQRVINRLWRTLNEQWIKNQKNERL